METAGQRSSISAMQMALEALEQIHPGNLTPMAEETWNKAITALRQALETEQEDDDRVMTVVYRNVQKEDAQSFTDHPKAVWSGWCHAPYQRDDAIFELEKAITSPPASKPWVGMTDGEIDILSCEMVKGYKSVNWLCKVLEAKLKEKNHG